MAERVGFEPTIQFPVYGTSNAAPSAARPPLHSTCGAAHFDQKWPLFNTYSTYSLTTPRRQKSLQASVLSEICLRLLPQPLKEPLQQRPALLFQDPPHH